MSEEPTKETPQKYGTKPTIETVLERINAMHIDMQVRFDRVEGVISAMRAEFLATRSEFLAQRADFTELKHALGEHIPALKA